MDTSADSEEQIRALLVTGLHVYLFATLTFICLFYWENIRLHHCTTELILLLLPPFSTPYCANFRKITHQVTGIRKVVLFRVNIGQKIGSAPTPDFLEMLNLDLGAKTGCVGKLKMSRWTLKKISSKNIFSSWRKIIFSRKKNIFFRIFFLEKFRGKLKDQLPNFYPIFTARISEITVQKRVRGFFRQDTGAEHGFKWARWKTEHA